MDPTSYLSSRNAVTEGLQRNAEALRKKSSADYEKGRSISVVQYLQIPLLSNFTGSISAI